MILLIISIWDMTTQVIDGHNKSRNEGGSPLLLADDWGGEMA